MAGLTVCLIARGEGEDLSAVLADIARLAQEVLVVAPPGTDVPTHHGPVQRLVVPADADAAVVHELAREASRGTWLLYLGAHERVPAATVAALSRAMASGDPDVLRIPVVNAISVDEAPATVAEGAGDDAPVMPRLFRRSRLLGWEGPTLPEPVLDIATRGTTRDLDLAVVDYGPAWDRRHRRDRTAELLTGLARELRDDSTAVRPALQAARLHLGRGDLDRASISLSDAWDRAQAHPGDHPWVTMTTLIAQIHLARGRWDDTLATLTRGRWQTGQHANFRWIEARCLARRAVAGVAGWRDDLEASAALLEQSLRVSTPPFEALPGVSTWLPRTALGVVHLLKEDATRALLLFDQALDARPGYGPARLGRIEALTEIDRAPLALREVEAALQLPWADGWVLAANACDRLGSTDHLERLLLAASKHADRSGFLEPHRCAMLDALRAVAKIREGLTEAVTGGPTPPSAEAQSQRPVPMTQPNRPGQQTAVTSERITRHVVTGPVLLTHAVRAESVRPRSKPAGPIRPRLAVLFGASAAAREHMLRVLSAHPAVAASESTNWRAPIAALAGALRTGTEPVPPGSREAEAVDRVLATLLGLDRDRGGWVLSELDNLGGLLPDIAAARPGARFVNLVRDPRSLVAEGAPHLPLPDQLAMAQRWASNLAATRAAAATIGDRYLEVRVEHLTGDPHSARTEVLQFLELDPESAAGRVPELALPRDDWRDVLSQATSGHIEAAHSTLLLSLGYPVWHRDQS